MAGGAGDLADGEALKAALAVALPRAGPPPLRAEKLRNAVSLGLRWTNPAGARAFVQKALAAGLLREEGEGLTPTSDLRDSLPQLGWQPPKRLFEGEPATPEPPRASTAPPVVAAPPVTAARTPTTAAAASATVLARPPPRVQGSAEDLTEALLAMLSASGVTPKEAVARANALHDDLGRLVPFPIVVALVARDHGLDVGGHVPALWRLVEPGAPVVR